MPAAGVAQSVWVAGGRFRRDTRNEGVGDHKTTDVGGLLDGVGMSDPGSDVVGYDVDPFPLGELKPIDQPMDVQSCRAHVIADVGLVAIAKAPRIYVPIRPGPPCWR